MTRSALKVGGTGLGSDTPIRVMMADDDRNDHLLLVMAADAAGIRAEFEFHDDGSHLLLRLAQLDSRQDLPDIIVLDLRMPGMHGLRTLEVLSDHPILWRVPVVVFTSSTRHSDAAAALQRGARWVETKPGDFGGLVEFTRSLVDRVNSITDSTADDTRGGVDEWTLASYRADTIADIEDELLFRFPEL
ncbi:MAG: response regulator [Acidimicrobiales bacterium]|nr:response regulator [Acidimicrobiales bacterium]